MASKKGNNYIIDKENNVAHIELIREKKENLWTTIDLEDLDRVLNFPFSWTTRYDKTLHDYYAVSIVYEKDENGIRKGKPLYLHRFIMNSTDENEWIEMTEKYKFKFSLYPNDLVKIKRKNEKEFYAYYCSTHRGTGAINLLAVNGESKIDGIGAKSLEIFEKYQVDVLGNISKVNKEKREGVK